MIKWSPEAQAALLQERGTTGTAVLSPDATVEENEDGELAEAKKDVWERQPNRQMRRDVYYLRGAAQPNRSRIRRRINRIRKQKGAWQ